MVLPRYGERALSDVLPSVASAIGLEGYANVLQLPPASGYVVMLVDGLGWHLLADHADEAPYLSSLMGLWEPLTVGVPATTATSLTSLGTALAPGRHGVVGYTCRIPGTLALLNALKWDAEVDPLVWQPHPTALELMAMQQVEVSVVNKSSFEGSGLTLCSQRGVPFRQADTSPERLATIVDTMTARPCVTYAYESRLDHTGHEHGADSDQWRRRLAAVDDDLLRLRAALPPDVAMLVTGDHGMIDIPSAGRFDVDDEPDLLREVPLFGGEARLRHLYCRAGATDDVAARWRERLGDDALVVTRDAAEAAGWFGDVEPQVRPRIGDVLVAGLGEFAVFSSRRFSIEQRMTGFHGSLSAAEMLVPLLVDSPRR